MDLTTVNPFNFASDLFLRYLQGRNYRKIKSARKLNISIIAIETRKRNLNICECEMVFHWQNATINAVKINRFTVFSG